MEHEYTPPILDYTDSNATVEERYNQIKSMLSEYACIVDFVKVNGEERSMPCTLRADLMPVASQIIGEDIGTAEVNHDLITVWCTDANGWRAMRTMNIKKVMLEPKRWTITVEEDPETGEMILPLPEDLIKLQGWNEGDTLKWEDNKDGSWSLTKKEE